MFSSTISTFIIDALSISIVLIYYLSITIPLFKPPFVLHWQLNISKKSHLFILHNSSSHIYFTSLPFPRYLLSLLFLFLFHMFYYFYFLFCRLFCVLPFFKNNACFPQMPQYFFLCIHLSPEKNWLYFLWKFNMYSQPAECLKLVGKFHAMNFCSHQLSTFTKISLICSQTNFCQLLLLLSIMVLNIT